MHILIEDLRIKASQRLDQIVALLQTPGGFSKLGINQRKFLFGFVLGAVVPADSRIRAVELEKLKVLLQSSLSLPPTLLDEAIALATTPDSGNTRLNAIATALQDLLGTEDRSAMIGHLWSLALSDSELHDTEERLIYQVADLAGIPRKKVAERLARAAAQA